MTEASDVYLRLKRIFADAAPGAFRRGRPRAERESDSVPFGLGRDPRALGSVMDVLTGDLGWSSPLAASDVLNSWPEIAGEDNAAHSFPESIADGVLVIRCETSAWATNLRLLRHGFLERVKERYPHAELESIRFQGPDVPSWKRGPRSIPGRGPRDTYG